MSSIALTLRSLMWAALLPGFFAGVAPWYFFGLDTVRIDRGDPVQLIGIIVAAIGIVLLASCIWEFARRGRGTLSPLDPPRVLVVEGLYRFVRNPMYLSVTLIILGELLIGASRGLLLFWIAWFAGVNLFVMLYEEPALRRQFGSSYDRYVKSVGRWIPRLKPYTMES